MKIKMMLITMPAATPVTERCNRGIGTVAYETIAIPTSSVIKVKASNLALNDVVDLKN